MSDDRANPAWRYLAVPAAILTIVMLASFAAAAMLWQAARERDQARFHAEVRLAATALANRIETHVALLRGTTGLFAGSDRVTAHEFGTYVGRLGLGSRYPGVLGIGYSERLDADEIPSVVGRMRRNGAKEFRVWPAEPRGTYHSILYLFPLNRRNQAAIGYDMSTHPVRREAMERARDQGGAATSGKVLLVQEIDRAKQPGFLIYLPIYEGGAVPATVAGRRERLIGFAYSPLRAHDLISTVFPPGDNRAIDLAIYDGAPTPDNLLYETSPRLTEEAKTGLTTDWPVDVAGRRWTIRAATTPVFARDSNVQYAAWAAGLGLIAALLLAGAAAAQARAAAATERAREALRDLNATLETRVAERTSELAHANRELTEEMARRETAENQVRQMQKMEAVGQLTGGIAHDFNNMLAVVIGSLDMARRHASETDRVARLVEHALGGATRAATLTQRLLAFSRRQPLAPQPVDANRLVTGMSELLRRTLGERVRLETRLADGLWRAHVDPGQLENAILNLALNARDAMPEGGTLTLETANRPLDDGTADAPPDLARGDYVLITVADSGVGMPPEVAGQAFDPFFTTKEVGKGTGLGLSQVFGFVRQSNGHVEIESEEGRGTRVNIYLPRDLGAEPGHASGQTAPGSSPGGAPDEIVLVVEDEDQVRRMTVEALRDLGYTVLHASGGKEALRILEALPGIHLLFTDVVMPGMNGRELADEAARRWPDLRILFTTGYARDAMVKEGTLEAGVDWLAKPFTMDQLAAKVRDVFDR